MDTNTTEGVREDILSLEDIVRLIYYVGLSSYGHWEEMIQKLKPEIIKLDDADVFSLFVKLMDITKKIKLGLETTILYSQKDIPALNTYIFDIDMIYNYLNSYIINFKEKNISKTIFTFINNLIRKHFITFNTEENDDIMTLDDDDDNDNDNDNDDDDDDEFDKIFTSVKRSKSKNNKTDDLFEQFVSFRSNDSCKTLTTPGERGSYLIKIDISDTKDLRGVDKKDRWLKAAYRSQFLLKTKDSIYHQLHKIILTKSRELTKIKNVKKQTFKN